MNPSNTIIVVSRYVKDTSWTRDFANKGYVTLVYEHGENGSVNNPYNLNINKGKEASVYLKYIIDKYDSLPKYTVFLHDKQYSWHHAGNLVDLVLKNQGKDYNYFNFNNRTCASIRNDVWKEMKWFYNKFLSPQLGPIEYFGDWTVNHLCCAQFDFGRGVLLCVSQQALCAERARPAKVDIRSICCCRQVNHRQRID